MDAISTKMEIGNVKKRKNWATWSMLALMGTTILACILIPGSVYYQKQQAYRQDVDDLLAIAAALGYTPDRYIRSYRDFGGNTPDVIVVVFYSDESWEQFVSRVQALGFNQLRYSQRTNPDFLEMDVNHQFVGSGVTLNDHYTDEDFLRWPAPVVTHWYLMDAQSRGIEIYYAQTPDPTDVWKYNGQVVPGNIVLVSFDRSTTVFDQMFPYPELEELIIGH
jgi:hypothetical protein